MNLTLPYRPSIQLALAKDPDGLIALRTSAAYTQAVMLDKLHNNAAYIQPVGSLDEKHLEYEAFLYTLTAARARICDLDWLEPIMSYTISMMLYNGWIPSNILFDRDGNAYHWFLTSDEMQEYHALCSIAEDFVMSGLIDEEQYQVICGSTVVPNVLWRGFSVRKQDREIRDWDLDFGNLLMLYRYADFSRDVRIHLDGYISYDRRSSGDKQAAGESAEDTSISAEISAVGASDSGVPQEE